MDILFNTRCWNHDYYGGGNVGRRLLWLGLSYVYRMSRKTRNNDISFTGDDFLYLNLFKPVLFNL